MRSNLHSGTHDTQSVCLMITMHFWNEQRSIKVKI